MSLGPWLTPVLFDLALEMGVMLLKDLEAVLELDLEGMERHLGGLALGTWLVALQKALSLLCGYFLHFERFFKCVHVCVLILVLLFGGNCKRNA